jgi:hypothetical protein
VLKWAFGTATLSDVQELHETVDKMHRTDVNIIHSVNNQMTYLKTLDSAVKFTTEAVDGEIVYEFNSTCYIKEYS